MTGTQLHTETRLSPHTLALAPALGLLVPTCLSAYSCPMPALHCPRLQPLCLFVSTSQPDAHLAGKLPLPMQYQHLCPLSMYGARAEGRVVERRELEQPGELGTIFLEMSMYSLMRTNGTMPCPSLTQRQFFESLLYQLKYLPLF